MSIDQSIGSLDRDLSVPGFGLEFCAAGSLNFFISLFVQTLPRSRPDASLEGPARRRKGEVSSGASNSNLKLTGHGHGTSTLAGTTLWRYHLTQVIPGKHWAWTREHLHCVPLERIAQHLKKAFERALMSFAHRRLHRTVRSDVIAVSTMKWFLPVGLWYLST